MWQLIKDLLMVVARWFVKKEQPQVSEQEVQETQEAQDAVAGKTDDEVESVDGMSDSERLDAAVAAGIVRPDGAGGASYPPPEYDGIKHPHPSPGTKHKGDSEPDS